MLLSDLVFTVLFLAQTGIGLLGNSVLLMLYLGLFISQPQSKKTTDLIFGHLTVVNTLTLLTQAVPGMVMAFRWESTLDVVGCQIVLYIRRVARGLSICTTSLLSVFQAITISPSNSRWDQFKHRASKYIPFAFVLFWSLNLLVEMNIIKSIAIIKNVTDSLKDHSRKTCISMHYLKKLNNISFLTAKTLRDVFFVLLMSCSSGYMVIILDKHSKQVQHIHSTSLSPSPASRATQTILLLVSCFVSFYFINSGITLALAFIKDNDLSYFDPTLFLGSCYAFLCPLVLIISDPRISKLSKRQCVL
ncbi:vomeronasal 1 receptor ornAnaV1R3052 [Ornithorhynchus anatinus]|uniref:Vomeronasal type-1 receptor n=1 Tax=Ornithorhynchus anatinus TaxID=9258 RepID=F7D2N2_ORNAN|nr:vomeronasal 1 receptor ornAnaV1R3052 [Ornithorhynchus anatinus]